MSTVSHSELLAKKILDHYFFAFRKLDNYKPVWLQGLELDRFYSDLGVAVEFQGKQHFLRTSELGQSQEAFDRGLKNDQRKRQLVESQGLKLIALDIFDLTPERIKRYVSHIVQVGLTYSTFKGLNEVAFKLKTLRLDKEPDKSLFRSADRLSRSKTKPKKSFWARLFGG